MTARLAGLGETARFFLKMGLVAFGGPSAHIAMLEDEVVARRRWMSREHFLDLVGATNLIPGPNSTEMMMHVGYERHGWAGLVTAGSLFVLPAALISGFGAWLYVRYGSLPELSPLLFGIKPAILVVILAAVWRLGKSAIKGPPYVVIGAVVAVAVL
ncbi:MAG: chromate transporter, partial [Acidobacteria bacterium]